MAKGYKTGFVGENGEVILKEDRNVVATVPVVDREEAKAILAGWRAGTYQVIADEVR